MSGARIEKRIKHRLKRTRNEALRWLKALLRRWSDRLGEHETRYYQRELTFPQIIERLTAKGGDHVYRYLEIYYLHRAPEWVRELRSYYVRQGSFGEAAFFAMWYKLWTWLKPKRCLEIGVYKGQTLALWEMLGVMTGAAADKICGLSTFDGMGDAVSSYKATDYQKLVKELSLNCGLRCPTLMRSRSDSREGKRIIEEGDWDLIYIDGSHDYEVVLSDYESAHAGLVPGGILVMDDSSLLLEGIPPATRERFPGHPGPSKVLHDRARKEMEHLLTVGHNNVLRKT